MFALSRPLLRATAITAALCYLLTLVALVAPTWIESAVGLSPDGGSGEVEWGLAAAFGAAAVALSLVALWSRHRIRVGARG